MAREYIFPAENTVQFERRMTGKAGLAGFAIAQRTALPRPLRIFTVRSDADVESDDSGRGGTDGH